MIKHVLTTGKTGDNSGVRSGNSLYIMRVLQCILTVIRNGVVLEAFLLSDITDNLTVISFGGSHQHTVEFYLRYPAETEYSQARHYSILTGECSHTGTHDIDKLIYRVFVVAVVSVIVIGTRYIRLSDKECLCIICHVSHLIDTLIVEPDEKNHQNRHKYVGGFRSRNHTVNYIGKLIACLFVF